MGLGFGLGLELGLVVRITWVDVAVEHALQPLASLLGATRLARVRVRVRVRVWVWVGARARVRVKVRVRPALA